MSIFYVKNEQIRNDEAIILGEDVKHIRDVLRYHVEDCLNICSEEGKQYLTKIVGFSKDKITLHIIEQSSVSTEPSVQITLLQGMPKADKLEWVIQKCTELGVHEVIPVMTDHVVVKWDDKSIEKKVERWNKIALEAGKQSGRQKIPEVKKPINFKNLVENLSKYDIVILPYEGEKKQTLKVALQKVEKSWKRIAILIGPEGGFSPEEIAAMQLPSVQIVTLGSRILRTETAAIATVAMTLYELET